MGCGRTSAVGPSSIPHARDDENVLELWYMWMGYSEGVCTCLIDCRYIPMRPVDQRDPVARR
jgi:hypothetical protein